MADLLGVHGIGDGEGERRRTVHAAALGIAARQHGPVARVESGFGVEGCSRSFESNVQWKLIARDGAVLASGNTQGGGVDGPAAFSFTIPYAVDAQQIGHLEVSAEDPSDGEGFPPGRTVLPLVLKP